MDQFVERSESIVETLPYELIETILLLLNISVLIIAASCLPACWRQVIETSTKLRPDIETFFHGPTIPSASDVDDTSAHGSSRFSKPTYSRTFVEDIGNHLLYVHRVSDGSRSFIIKDKREGTLQVLDPTSLEAVVDDRYDEMWDYRSIVSVRLYDWQGRVACTFPAPGFLLSQVCRNFCFNFAYRIAIGSWSIRIAPAHKGW